MAAFMLCMGVDKKLIKSKVRRLLAKSHIGLIQTQSVDNLLDVIVDMVNSLLTLLTDILTFFSRGGIVEMMNLHLHDTTNKLLNFLKFFC